MSYIELDDLLSKIPMKFLIEAMDDDNDGCVDDNVWAEVQESVSDEINGVLGQRFDTPIVNPPQLIKEAARVLALETIYLRRGFHTDEDNPWASRARATRKKLDAIATSDQPLMPGRKNDKPQTVQVISEPSRTHSRYGHNST